MASLNILKSRKNKYRVSWCCKIMSGPRKGETWCGSRCFQSKPTANAFLRQVEAKEEVWRAGMEMPATSTAGTLTTLIEDYLASTNGLRPRTIEFYRFVLDKFKAHVGTENLEDIGGPAIQEFLDNLNTGSSKNNHLLSAGG